ncbi:MAG: PQQ-dependent sugar dehydrogenase [Actinomycetota bacterium]
MPRPRLASLLLIAALFAAACDSDGGSGGEPSVEPSGTDAPTESPSASPEPSGIPRIELEPVVNLDQPLAMAVRNGDRSLYFAEKVGRVIALRDGSEEPEVLLDLTSEVSTGSEQGLLGLAFSPDGEFLYVNFTDVAGDTRVVEFAFNDRGVNLSSRREVLFVDQPYSNHNGGNLAFGPDGYLYIGLGDGGSAGDPEGNAQSLSTLLGKMLRIDPRPEGGEPYGIPRDNPFVDRDDARLEIWAYGLRNPWRYSFDRETGDLWIGDVGQGSREEIDFARSGSRGGENYAWDLLEGTLRFEGDAPPDDVPPVFEYPTADGCAVTGGYVYRGQDVPALVGAYVFADFCQGRLEAFRLEDGQARGFDELGPEVANIASFGEDADGELYVLSLSGPVFRLVPA